ncbi:putative Lysine methyltransferase [Trypanosoma vivax]|nr:putative Lysine methyltransferase [Trypanosoma vivax]
MLQNVYTPGAAPSFVSVRLAAGQFSNVGLALWPAAFVLVQLLDAELSAPSPELTDGLGETLRLLELGAGVGLTPLLLHHLRPYNERVSRFVLTDYQQELVENISFNLNDVAWGCWGQRRTRPNAGASRCIPLSCSTGQSMNKTAQSYRRGAAMLSLQPTACTTSL